MLTPAMFFTGLMQAIVFLVGVITVVSLGLLTLLILRFVLFIFRMIVSLFWRLENPHVVNEEVHREERRTIFIDTRGERHV